MYEKIDYLQTEIINTIKLLIYKETPSLLEKVDFDDDDVFLEPLLFAYFNSKKENLFPTTVLEEIMQGYFVKNEAIKINYSFNKNNIAYIPCIGYFRKGESTPFESTHIIENTTIEVLKYPVNLLQSIFKNTDGVDLINQDEIAIDNALFERNIPFLTNALQLIKENSFSQFQLIEQCCKKCLLFQTDPSNTNSFATINAHGIAFFNAYQEDYDEVFFVDDIAHQTGHIILTTLFHTRKAIFKIDESQQIEAILNKKDHRDIYILFHALYTYYATFMCLDDCLTNNVFNERQKKEAIGRIGFYLNKCSVDLSNLEIIEKHFNGIQNVLTSDGIEVYDLIKNKYVEVYNKWNAVTSTLNYENQAYNFSFSIFVANNNSNL
jgi:hypothetical protein